MNETILERRRGLGEDVIVKRRKAAADPTRLRILERFYEDRDWTAKELADALGLGANGLYYHLRILEDAQLVVPGGGRPGSKGLERTFRRADNLHVDWELDENLVMHGSSILEAAKHDVAESVYEARAEVEAGEKRPQLVGPVGTPGIRTTRDEIFAFHQRLNELINEFRTRAKTVAGEDDRVMLKLTYALRERPLPEAQ